MSEPTQTVTCPICGKEAETGALYSEDLLIWLAGKPDWKKRLVGIFYPGVVILGRFGFPRSSYEGIYCKACDHIVISHEKPKNYFPDVKGG